MEKTESAISPYEKWAKMTWGEKLRHVKRLRPQGWTEEVLGPLRVKTTEVEIERGQSKTEVKAFEVVPPPAQKPEKPATRLTLLTIEQASKALGVSTDTVRRLKGKGKLPFQRFRVVVVEDGKGSEGTGRIMHLVRLGDIENFMALKKWFEADRSRMLSDKKWVSFRWPSDGVWFGPPGEKLTDEERRNIRKVELFVGTKGEAPNDGVERIYGSLDEAHLIVRRARLQKKRYAKLYESLRERIEGHPRFFSLRVKVGNSEAERVCEEAVEKAGVNDDHYGDVHQHLLLKALQTALLMSSKNWRGYLVRAAKNHHRQLHRNQNRLLPYDDSLSYGDS